MCFENSTHHFWQASKQIVESSYENKSFPKQICIDSYRRIKTNFFSHYEQIKIYRWSTLNQSQLFKTLSSYCHWRRFEVESFRCFRFSKFSTYWSQKLTWSKLVWTQEIVKTLKITKVAYRLKLIFIRILKRKNSSEK